MLGSSNAYNNYFDNDDYEDFDEDEYIYLKRKRIKIIIIVCLVTILSLFIVFSVVACSFGVNNNPYIQYDLTERNDFNKDFTSQDVIKEYYP